MFVLFALARNLRVYSWEGSSRVDFVTDYIPWALERCTNTCPVDVVCCCLEQRDGLPRMMPVSEEHPLSECRHFVAAAAVPPVPGALGDGFENWYLRNGLAILPSVLDGDCGLDVACILLGLPRTFLNRVALREELSDYLMDRIHESWMQDLMCACQELDAATVMASRAHNPEASVVAAAVAADPIAVEADEPEGPPLCEAADPMPPHESVSLTDEIFDLSEAKAALKWSTHVRDDAVLDNLLATLPVAIIREQISAWKKGCAKDVRSCGRGAHADQPTIIDASA